MNAEHLAAERKKISTALWKQINKCVYKSRKLYTKDFFIIALFLPKKKGDQKAVQIKVRAIDTINTPVYDSSLFKYHYKDDRLELLWTLPPMQDALYMYHNQDKIHPSEYCLLRYVIDYFDGTIFKKIAEWENSDGAIAREREHASRDAGTATSSIFG